MREFIWITSDNTSEDYLYEIVDSELPTTKVIGF